MKKTIFLTLFFGIGFFTISSATEYYVSSLIGSNSYNGTSVSTPYATLQYAADRTNPGDVVNVMNGNYTTTGMTLLSITRSGSTSQSITYKKYLNHNPIVLGTNNVWNTILINASNIIIDGLELQGDNANITYTDAKKAYDDYIKPLTDLTRVGPQSKYNTNAISFGSAVNVVNVIVKNCKVHDFPGGGIGGSNCDYITIENNTVYNNSWYTMYATSGISILTPLSSDANTGYKIFVRKNIVYNNKTTVPWEQIRSLSDGNGIIIDVNTASGSYVGYNGKTLVENNVSYNNGGGGVHAYKANNVTILNNTAYNNGTVVGYPEIDGSQGSNILIYNNIMYARSGGNCNVNDVTSTYDYNLYFNGPAFRQGLHDIIANPQFVNLATDGTANFQLKNISPAINTGTNTTGLFSTTDILGIARPFGAGIDRGAYEFTGTLGAIPSFTEGNLAVLRVGDGTTTLSSNASPANIVEFSPSGVATATNVILSNSASTTPNRLALTGDGTTLEGQLNLSNDGRFLTVTGYDASIGADPTTYKANEKLIARINYVGEADYTTRLSAATLNGTVRSTVSENGSRYYITGSSTSPASGNSTRFLNFAAPTSTTSTAFNGPVRSLAMFKDQVYFANNNVVGSLTPNPASGNFATVVPFPGVNASGHNYQAMTLVDFDPNVSYLSTGYDILYTADASLGLVKHYWNGSNWVLAGTFNPTVSGVSGGIYALTAKVVGGNMQVFAIKGAASDNAIILLTDASGLTGNIGTTNPTLQLLSKSGTNYMYRGIAFAPAQISTLPIELVYFRGNLNTNGVSLNWKTASEINAKEFVIEKTTDGLKYKVVGSVKAKNAAVGFTYNFIDAEVLKGLSYYRLKALDNDGTFKYSDIVSIKNNLQNEEEFLIYPNPVVGIANLKYPTVNLSATLTLVNINGNKLAVYPLPNASNQSTLDFSGLSKGYYILIFANGNQNVVKSFIK